MRELVRCQWARLEQYVVADADLADIMKQPGQVQIVDFAARKAHLFANLDGDPGDALAVAARVWVLGVDGRRQASDDAEQSFLEVFVVADVSVVADLKPPDDRDDPELGLVERDDPNRS